MSTRSRRCLTSRSFSIKFSTTRISGSPTCEAKLRHGLQLVSIAGLKMSRNTQASTQNDELLLSEDQCSTPDTAANQSQASEGQSTSAASVSREDFDGLQKERDSLFDRLARLQAEFENFRKRNAREQTEFREYATAEAA